MSINIIVAMCVLIHVCVRARVFVRGKALAAGFTDTIAVRHLGNITQEKNRHACRGKVSRRTPGSGFHNPRAFSTSGIKESSTNSRPTLPEHERKDRSIGRRLI